ncbi:MAG: aminotransferase class I/II-fold pyridoxal phosphate-dependent enzyme [Magnetospirillum sp.]|nr:aminotransferase class I/II-fold pyridoxal phosphate-dependent enzyme [Magnetospirillum sp.]
MIKAPVLPACLDQLPEFPFTRLALLLGGPPTPDCLNMAIGEPQNPAPAIVAEQLAANGHLWNKYPPGNGTPDFRKAVAGWLGRRYGLPAGLIDPDKAILPLAGTREGLYLIAQTVCGQRQGAKPYVLMPNPFYQVYGGAAVMGGGEMVFVPGARSPSDQPDYSALPPEVLERTALAFLCSPANPQGNVADLALLERSIRAARHYGFVLASDECYSEIWDKAPPVGALAACAALGEGLDNVLVFNSLSKRSSVPGLRSGFIAGDERLIAAFTRVRAHGGPTTPMPILATATALWNDEAHVGPTRDLYRAKLDVAERLLKGRFGFARPEGGFFLWLNVGDGEAAAKRLWDEGKIRVLPGAYLATADAAGDNPGQPFIRVALVHDLATTETALTILSQILGG